MLHQEPGVVIPDPSSFAAGNGNQENYYNYGPYITLGIDFY
jgi:hypothetical protein